MAISKGRSMDKFYFTHPAISMRLMDELLGVLVRGKCCDSPDECSEGDLFEVTINRVGVVRKVTEVEMNGEGND
jgi:hypothetical protein